MELQVVLQAVKDFFETEAPNKFADLDNDFSKSPEFSGFVGYKWRENGRWHYLVLSRHFRELWCRNISVAHLAKELDSRNWLARRSTGKLLDTKSVNGQNKRGFVFLPDAWANDD